MENELKEQVLDKITKVCICKAIPRSKIKDAIKAGAHTVSEVSKATGACTGGCKGYRCIPKIEALIDEHLKNS
ncbi:(2Fe-2S)-binding protein [Caproiciproducens sp. MSJ-32]|uniref:(2Fe-2S)-binding protein n=1 Tax=Caproiciproducens sp. MSJ-32 TaxID=2841527 RepID=UPI001C0F3F05|nr:(2Fe-2S)-binding protein [Caproiciproducens sp. MSJ-32]MBU5453939.1 (2Fe-2S)-binding protein [Caproiciproducens sp. MSJ-32]